jgi:hypothetical protein
MFTFKQHVIAIFIDDIEFGRLPSIKLTSILLISKNHEKKKTRDFQQHKQIKGVFLIANRAQA